MNIEDEIDKVLDKLYDKLGSLDYEDRVAYVRSLGYDLDEEAVAEMLKQDKEMEEALANFDDGTFKDKTRQEKIDYARSCGLVIDDELAENYIARGKRTPTKNVLEEDALKNNNNL